MTRTTLAACGAAFVTAALSAQTPPPQPAPGQLGSVAGQPMSLTGCLKPWDPSTMDTGGAGASGTAGTSGATMPGASAGTAAGAPRFVLTGTEHAPASGAGATTPQGSPSPTTNPNPTLGAHGTFILEAHSPSVNFASFVNQQVRVTGTMLMEGAAPARGTAGTGGAATGTTGARTPTTSTGGTPTTTPAGTPTASGTPTSGSTPTSTMAQKAGAAAARVSFTVTSITTVAKTCS